MKVMLITVLLSLLVSSSLITNGSSLIEANEEVDELQGEFAPKSLGFAMLVVTVEFLFFRRRIRPLLNSSALFKII